MTAKEYKIVFRCDASIQIGSGHVMRCLTLADELSRQGAESFFICRQHDGSLMRNFKTFCHECTNEILQEKYS